MRKFVTASKKKLSDRDMGFLVDKLCNELRAICKKRGKDEYVDDVSWGNSGCRIPIFVDVPIKNPTKGRLPFKPEEVAVFEFYYDSDDDYSAEEQAEIQLDEFIEEWSYEDDSDIEYVGDDFIQDAVRDTVKDVYDRRDEFNDEDEMWDEIIDMLQSAPYNLIYDEDFYSDDVLEEIESYNWDK